VDFLRRRNHVLEQMQNKALSPLKTAASPPGGARRWTWC
jgi:hypothetical protein